MSQQLDSQQTFRRHRDGSIDFDHYRSQAAAFRSIAKRDTAKVKAMLQFVAVITFLTVGAAFVFNGSASDALHAVVSHSAGLD